MAVLNKIELRGFKSIKDATLELRQLNVLIGSNGAGKSNLISFFKMLNEMMDRRLQQYIATGGRAQSLLHFGAKVTPQMEATLEFETAVGPVTYFLRLSYAAEERLVFAEETLRLLQAGGQRPKEIALGTGHFESRIGEEADKGEPSVWELRYALNHCRVFHFHDTSSTARMQQHCYVGNNKWLMHDAGNLAAVLYRLREEEGGTAYQRIVSTIRLIAPFFADFELELTGPSGREIILNWREEGSDLVLGPHQLSDGTLRAICLVTLLLLPEDDLPYLIVVDEPELGLHPYALSVVASLFSKVSNHAQVLTSTQSSTFVDNFEPEDIVVVDREEQGSTFARPDAEALAKWLEDYSLGEVWEKNVIGGGPH